MTTPADRRAARLAARDKRVRERIAARHRAAALGAQRTAEAQSRWRGGHVVPHTITIALDLAGLYGPEVDHACGVEEPTVDLWEAGEEYPTWPQLLALAELTKFGVGFFTRPLLVIEPAPWWKAHFGASSSQWHALTTPPVLTWSPRALREHTDRLRDTP